MITTMSSKGQVVLPRPLREAHRWSAGTKLEIEDRGDSVVLRAIKPRMGMRMDQVLGCTGYRGPARSIKEMDAAVRREARKHA